MIAPDALDVATLPFLPLAAKRALPLCPALYFVLGEDDVILYIGRAKSLKQRWTVHHKTFSPYTNLRIAWLALDDPGLLPSIEKACILYFKPLLNREMNSRAKQGYTAHQKPFSVRLRKEFMDCVAQRATKERRSVNAQFETIIEQWVRQEYGEEVLEAILASDFATARQPEPVAP